MYINKKLTFFLFQHKKVVYFFSYVKYNVFNDKEIKENQNEKS